MAVVVVKAAITKILTFLILTMNQMSSCTVKEITHSDKPTENITSAVPLSSTEHFSIFQLIVLVSWFSLTALIDLLTAAAGSCSVKRI